MTEHYSITDGQPTPLGATLMNGGCNFAVHAPQASNVMLCFFHGDTEEPLLEIPMPVKTGKVWHCHVSQVEAGMLYGYRVNTSAQQEPAEETLGHKLLIDPYARCLNRAMDWNARQYKGDSQFMLPKAVVCEPAQLYPVHLRPRHSQQDLILYEVHVKGISQRHPEVNPAHRGKYLGLCDPAIIEHLQHLGVTAVQLMPVAAFMPEPYITEKGLTNYWGYNPVNYFSPEPRYAIADPVSEFKTMVRQLHQAGIEVILDVVFNHTAEGGHDGPVLSFKGFDNQSYYLFEQNEFGIPDFQRYLNNSGCGNTVNTANPVVMTLVLDALRYWVEVMGVDGFRFDLAAGLGRDPYDFNTQSGLLRAIRQDPVLREVRLIAEPWDIGMGGYRLGQFPSHWHECNDKYRDQVRAFWRGDKGMTSSFATRLLGSRDIFHKGHRSIHSSVNMITYHDGFTLHDLVSYNERHNEENLEQSRDGHGHNLSFNYGVEGPTQDEAILALRARQKRNLFATLLFSQGVPHILGGDELSRTQKGNNNAYCQDNEISWWNWRLSQRGSDFLAFCKAVIRLRKNSELLSHLNLHDDDYSNQYNVEKVGWYRPDGARKVVDDWHDERNQAFAVELKGEGKHSEHWLLLFNASEQDVDFHLPQETQWYLLLDTAQETPPEGTLQGYRRHFNLAYRSLCLFACEKTAKRVQDEA
ncbi:glycogen debranching protein GlgX [Lacimicrobium sp. SS2-24]|uniref:glycogen debranching protein GlgX n=1 Tax=Lacimicrobium sp. SS2-24 TaxID=2005569 RepID=UPI000B4B42E3|nr:glycogen debranching protein GlgX [Lacimicrobium sp. SS2-24]